MIAAARWLSARKLRSRFSKRTSSLRNRLNQLVVPEKPQPPNDRKALLAIQACHNYQFSLR